MSPIGHWQCYPMLSSLEWDHFDNEGFGNVSLCQRVYRDQMTKQFTENWWWMLLWCKSNRCWASIYNGQLQGCTISSLGYHISYSGKYQISWWQTFIRRIFIFWIQIKYLSKASMGQICAHLLQNRLYKRWSIVIWGNLEIAVMHYCLLTF